MKNVLLSLALAFTSLVSYAQGWEWMRGACDTGSENGESLGQRVATDGMGNLYMAGMAWFNGHIGNVTFSSGGLSDIPLVKYDSNGNLKWVIFAGPQAMPYGLATDPYGNEIMFGYFDGPTFTFGSHTITNPLPPDSATCFISKIDSNGIVHWIKNLGNIKTIGNGRSLGNCLVAGKCGEFYLTTPFKSGFSINNDTFSTHGAEDIFIAKFDSSGNLLWGNSYGGSEPDWSSNISLATDGGLYITGLFKSDTLAFDNHFVVDTTTGVFLWTAFIAKFESSSGIPQWARASSGAVSCEGYGVAADGLGNVFMSGGYSITGLYPPAPVFFGSVSLPIVPQSHVYGFLVKYDGNGNEIWGKVSRSKFIQHKAITTDACNNVWVLGNNLIETNNTR